jgi:hypothetical protein
MRDVEDDRATGPFHDSEIERVDDQVVIPEGGPALAEQNFFVTGFFELLDDVSHLMGGEKLCFLDIDRPSGFGQSHDEIGLTAKEGGELEDVDYFGGRLGLVGFVDVGNNGYSMGLLDLGEDFQAFFQSGPPEGGDGRAIGLVEGCLEDVGDAEFGGNLLVCGRDLKGEFPGFQNVHSPEQGEWVIV